MFKRFFKKEINFIDHNNNSMFFYRLKRDILSISEIADNGQILDTVITKANIIKIIKIRMYYAYYYR